MREWRNWQTRTFEGRVVYTVRVQVPSFAPLVLAFLLDKLDPLKKPGYLARLFLLIISIKL